jgi:hypothetical protein
MYFFISFCEILDKIFGLLPNRPLFTSRIKIFGFKELKDLDDKNKEQYHNFAFKCLKVLIQDNLSWMQSTSRILTTLNPTRKRSETCKNIHN